jgi:autotransporter-associated beta strand protein
LSGSGNIDLSSGGLIVNQTQANVFSGNILGNADFTLDGSSTLTLTGNSSSYTGSIAALSGTLEISGAGYLGSSRPLFIGGSGVFSINADGNSRYIGSLSGSGSFNVNTLNNAVINQSQEETTFSGVFTGSGTMSMSLQYPLNLTGNSSAYLGQMNVKLGNLNLSGAR